MARKKAIVVPARPQHTPGPWKYGLRMHGRRPTWSQPDTNRPPSGTMDEPIIAVLAGELAICYCWSWSGGLAAMEANAHLIAAAPDLLAALEALVSLWDCQGDAAPSGIYDAEPWLAARAAVAKAKGA